MEFLNLRPQIRLIYVRDTPGKNPVFKQKTTVSTSTQIWIMHIMHDIGMNQEWDSGRYQEKKLRIKQK